jgi:RNA polymerase sigma factor (sigma-70 family)
MFRGHVPFDVQAKTKAKNKKIFGVKKPKESDFISDTKWGKKARMKGLITEKTEGEIKKETLGWKINAMDINKIHKIKNRVEVRNKFINENSGYVKDAVTMLHPFIGMEEAYQEGFLGFVEAINNFDTRRGVQGFQQFIRNYITGRVYHRIKDEAQKQVDSINRIIAQGGEGGDKELTIEDTTPAQYTGLEGIEQRDEQSLFWNTMKKIREEIKNPNARKVLDLMAVGFRKQEIMKKLKLGKSTITVLVRRHIKPLVDKYRSGLTFVKSKEFARFFKSMDEILDETVNF